MKTELHRSVMNQDGTMSMEQQEQIALFNSETVASEPGDFHVMLMGLTRILSPGDELTLTLDCQHHGELTINVPIQNP
jgi:copper(I)-binding protein